MLPPFVQPMENVINQILPGYIHEIQNNFPGSTIYFFPYTQVISIHWFCTAIFGNFNNCFTIYAAQIAG